MEETVFRNEHIEIRKNGSDYSLRALAPGMDMEGLEKLLKQHLPQVYVTSFVRVKGVLAAAPSGPVPLGTDRERVEVRISEDALEAYVTLWMEPECFLPANRAALIREVALALRKAAVTYGVLSEVFAGEIRYGTECLIARGKAPVPGEDATVTMIELMTGSPEVIDDGTVNHYEMNLIQRVKEGDWLGERVEPLPGIPGTDVCGRSVPPSSGVSTPLRYERSSVREEVLPGKTVLRARKAGAVFYRGDVVGVYDFLEVAGNVDFSTGNIDYDGYLSVKGTVDDHFSVAAERDIEILGEYGVGGADEIVSRAGNIYIRGGIAGKGQAVIRCQKNLYVKYLSDVTVECAGSVFIGFYAMNSHIRARQIIVDSPRGRIAGGHCEAEIRIEAAELGNRSETRTDIRVVGFDRDALRKEYERVVQSMDEGRKEMSRLKQKLRLFDSAFQTQQQQQEQTALRDQLEALKERLKDVEFEYKSLADHLRTPGEGAVIVKKHVYGNVHLQLKDKAEAIRDERNLTTFVYRGGELVEE